VTDIDHEHRADLAPEQLKVCDVEPYILAGERRIEVVGHIASFVMRAASAALGGPARIALARASTGRRPRDFESQRRIQNSHDLVGARPQIGTRPDFLA
jgi:hypothetical protein